MITVFGSINLDMVIRVADFPRPGETIPTKGFAMSAGGKGANQALAVRRAGGQIRMVGLTGADSHADLALALLKEAGVDLTCTGVCDESTGLAFIQVEDSGENTIAIVKGANGEVSAETAERMLADLSAGDILLLQQEIPLTAMERAIEIASRTGAKSVLNTAPFQTDYISLVDRVDVVISNETEFDALMPGSKPRPERAKQFAQERKRLLIVTLGADGAMVVEPGCEAVIVPSPKLETVVDTTGAGDTFCGYFCKMLADGVDPVAATRKAVAAASLACCKNGAQPSIPLASDLD
ncbi:ribokinase [uncultured Cohaesibacter sp.]|uniref:ribokinase n=1 Tax=uncultured Cohaesibacter sp. TaxID=1002546 RepID=UPI0029C8F795|nr:ribokinase [uncultured Cohaesibacter sp.]